ncbi:MAG TPA: hypothetical protein VMO17_07385, partial [Terriglobia bacterium]|nr:hypothetical protein [Terriglobia bacterium]
AEQVRAANRRARRAPAVACSLPIQSAGRVPYGPSLPDHATSGHAPPRPAPRACRCPGSGT